MGVSARASVAQCVRACISVSLFFGRIYSYLGDLVFSGRTGGAVDVEGVGWFYCCTVSNAMLLFGMSPCQEISDISHMALPHLHMEAGPILPSIA